MEALRPAQEAAQKTIVLLVLLIGDLAVGFSTYWPGRIIPLGIWTDLTLYGISAAAFVLAVLLLVEIVVLAVLLLVEIVVTTAARSFRRLRGELRGRESNGSS